MLNGRRLAVNGAHLGTGYSGTVDLCDALVTQADPENRDLAGERAYRVARDPGRRRISRPWRDHDRIRRQSLQICYGRVVPQDDRFRAKASESLSKVEHERVVVVDQEKAQD